MSEQTEKQKAEVAVKFSEREAKGLKEVRSGGIEFLVMVMIVCEVEEG